MKAAREHRIYCDACIRNGTCDDGGPFCDQCYETDTYDVQSLARAMHAHAVSYAAEAVKAEREACAVACEQLRYEDDDLVKRNAMISVVARIIRAGAGTAQQGAT